VRGSTLQRGQNVDVFFMRAALRLARLSFGQTSPNPMVGAVLVKGGKVIGRGWHRRTGESHAEIEAIRDALQRGNNTVGATLYVTLEPCSSHGRTPPCTEAVKAAGIQSVVAAATDRNPKHAGRGFRILRRAGIEVVQGILAEEADRLNEAFNHWIVRRTPFVTVKAAMTLDGKIATASGESKWITAAKARGYAMRLRQGADAILVGVNTVLADNPSLTLRARDGEFTIGNDRKLLRRIILDTQARTPLTAMVVNDPDAALTSIVVSRSAPARRVAALASRVNVLVGPSTRSQITNRESQIELPWLLKKLGGENVTNLLVEGGGEVNGSFLLGGLAQRVAFFYAPKILGGSRARKAVAGDGVRRPDKVVPLHDVEWRRLGSDLLMTALVDAG
jgi:diaminohydroxyphosphoribosylaminopyrimidine deaminase / 5-amino-6-(5-phosphoribosylamino)uracil reductase